MEQKQRNPIVRILAAIWHGVTVLKHVLGNLVVLALVVIVLVALISGGQKDRVQPGTALVLDLSGPVVEQEQLPNPLNSLLSGEISARMVVLRDVLEAVDHAGKDERISALVLNLEDLGPSSLSDLQVIGERVSEFRKGGKKVYAYGDYFSQGGYYLASFADEVFINPLGELTLTGFAAYSFYFREALDKLRVRSHVFRVGTYKAAVEPYLRDDMSAEARLANEEMIEGLWSSYLDDVAVNRNLSRDALLAYARDYPDLLSADNGNSASVALNGKLVDEILTRPQANDALIKRIGADEDSKTFRQVKYRQYLQQQRPPVTLPNPGVDQVAIVIAEGPLLMGSQSNGVAGADHIVGLINQARDNADVKALVLRVNSPGGSVYASEVIRRALITVQMEGKPVVVSMGSYAASGGYWISASADEVWAHRTTVTGSIGVFGVVNTYEDALNWLGVHVDGVSNTPMTSAVYPFRGLNDSIANVMQQSVDYSYGLFLDIVAEGRGMTTAQVDEIAQGRVWLGKQALELGLVDKLGDLEASVASAARLANLDTFDTLHVEPPVSPRDLFIRELITNAKAVAGIGPDNPLLSGLLPDTASRMGQVLQPVLRHLQLLDLMNDPKGQYSLCLSCMNH